MLNIERRQSYRINDTLLFSYHILTSSEIALAATQTQNCSNANTPPFLPISISQFPVTVNLSINGMGFATEEHFHVGDTVAIMLLLSRHAPPLRIVAKVVGFIADPEGNTGYVRLSFDTMAQYNRLRLANYTMLKVERATVRYS